MDVPERILQAALALLAQSGAHELTQPRVARAAGVRQSHLTYYFPTRADLLQAVAHYSIEKLAGQLEHARPGALPVEIAAGAADKRLARDNAEARAEAREVLKMAARFIAKDRR